MLIKHDNYPEIFRYLNKEVSERQNGIDFLAPWQLEIICEEYLRAKGFLKYKLLSTGKSMKNFDIIGVGQDGSKVFAQVKHKGNRNQYIKFVEATKEQVGTSSLFYFDDGEKLSDPVSGAIGFHFGTAFLVHTDEKYSYFITARHVAINCQTPTTFRCQLSLNTSFDIKEYKLVTTDQSVVSEINEIRIFEPNPNTQWSADTFSRDMGYFRVNRIDSAMTEKVNIGDNISVSLKDFPPAIAFQRTHFVLGYPYLDSRKSYQGLADHNVLKLRWSQGEFVEFSNSKSNQRFYSNADSLGGNSGGPVIAEDGSIMGILVGGPAIDGNEYAPMPSYFSYVVPYDYVKFMIGDILLGKSSTKIIFKAD